MEALVIIPMVSAFIARIFVGLIIKEILDEYF